MAGNVVSGVGIGMGRRLREVATLVDRLWRPSVCRAAALGSPAYLARCAFRSPAERSSMAITLGSVRERTIDFYKTTARSEIVGIACGNRAEAIPRRTMTLLLWPRSLARLIIKFSS